MGYEEAMEDLASALADAQVAAARAWRISKDQDGAPVKEIADIYDSVTDLTVDAESLADHGVTRATLNDMKALYEGEKLAGLV